MGEFVLFVFILLGHKALLGWIYTSVAERRCLCIVGDGSDMKNCSLVPRLSIYAGRSLANNRFVCFPRATQPCPSRTINWCFWELPMSIACAIWSMLFVSFRNTAHRRKYKLRSFKSILRRGGASNGNHPYWLVARHYRFWCLCCHV